MEVGKKYIVSGVSTKTVFECMGISGPYCWMKSAGGGWYTYDISIFKEYKEPVHFGKEYVLIKYPDTIRITPLFEHDDNIFYVCKGKHGNISHAIMDRSTLDTHYKPL